ncbi:MAG TPA: AtpZ/AtpI family protein [Bryobacteraceae bacterium]|nr:AtpZ/AtpI family protein [Bryobacteraceae bacterium]
MNDKRGSVWVQVGRYLSIATLLPAATAAGYLIGYGLDHLFHTRFLRIVCLMLGIAAGFINLFRELGRDQ